MAFWMLQNTRSIEDREKKEIKLHRKVKMIPQKKARRKRNGEYSIFVSYSTADKSSGIEKEGNSYSR